MLGLLRRFSTPDLAGALLRPALAALALIATAACADSTGTEEGRVSILLTDAPGDFLEATVTIDRVELVGEAEDQEGPGTTLLETPVTTDLLTLANDALTLVEDFTLAAGTYSQLRFVIPGACIVVEGEDGEGVVYASDGYEECGAPDGHLQMPSFAQSGLKVTLPAGAVTVTGEQQVLLVDFDVSESFGRQAGNSGRWVLSPVVKATELQLTSSVAATLTLADSVALPEVAGAQTSLADFMVAAADADGDDEGSVPLTDPEGDGTFTARFHFLLPDEGPFSLTLVHDSIAVTTDPASPLEVEVSSGGEATTAAVVTSAVRIQG